MLEVEVFGTPLLLRPLLQCEVERLCTLALASAGVEDGHVAVEFVGADRIGDLNAEHRGKQGPTDVLSFPIDGADVEGVDLDEVESDEVDLDELESDELGSDEVELDDADLDDSDSDDAGLNAAARRPGDGGPPRELGDIVICPEHTVDLREAIVHGALHLVGMDHETDEGQMLAVQAEILRWGRE